MAVLPQELIDLIITQIDLHDRRALETLSSCCTVARCFLSASRARLWSRLPIPEDCNSAAELHDMLVSSGTLAPLVQTIAIWCAEDLPIETFHLFNNVTHVEFLGRLEFLPDEVTEYIAESWNVSAITFRETAFDDICMDLIPLLHEFSNLKEIRFTDCECRGYNPTLEEVADGRTYADVVVSAPESLYMDLTSFGISITEIVLAKPWIFSLERVRRLTFAFHAGGSIPERSEAMMHKILNALPQPLQELSFRHHDSLPLEDDSKLIPIARIPQISFDIYQDNRPLETMKWWLRNLQDAWTNQRDSWVIREIHVNVVIDSRGRYIGKGVFDDLLVPDVWSALDEILAAVQLKKLVVRVQAVESIDDEEVSEFESLLRGLFPLSRKRKEFLWGEMWRLLFYS
ncbi:hypothetical protein BDZ89DRAFT_1060275 [Hymenopellis radicata]|nr:hypothetical protein BDZ89DRAFT_1060275 [Hymenopellis radicata]